MNLVEISTDRFTVDHSRKLMTVEISDLTRSYLPQCINIRSHKTGRMFPFSTTAIDEVWDTRNFNEERELIAWDYHSAWLPGWTVRVFND